jgi:hypothetical protein
MMMMMLLLLRSTKVRMVVGGGCCQVRLQGLVIEGPTLDSAALVVADVRAVVAQNAVVRGRLVSLRSCPSPCLCSVVCDHCSGVT